MAVSEHPNTTPNNPSGITSSFSKEHTSLFRTLSYRVKCVLSDDTTAVVGSVQLSRNAPLLLLLPARRKTVCIVMVSIVILYVQLYSDLLPTPSKKRIHSNGRQERNGIDSPMSCSINAELPPSYSLHEVNAIAHAGCHCARSVPIFSGLSRCYRSDMKQHLRNGSLTHR